MKSPSRSTILAALSLLISCASAFHSSAPLTRTPTTTASHNSPTALHAIEDVDTARTAFYIWFFGASGGAGIARSTFPRIYNNFVDTRARSEMEPIAGGETVGISPLIGYPRDLYVQDVQKVLQTCQNIDAIVNKYPIEGNMWSMRYGYLTFKAWDQANEAAKNNPLAVRAVMDAMAKSSDVVAPEVAQEKMNAYLADLNEFKADLLKNKLTGYSAFFVLLFLLGLADVVAAGHAYHGWFPEWPGAEGFPFTIFDAEKGLATIPQYWI